MKEPLRCRHLLGHEDKPELALETESLCRTLSEPLPVQYVRLTGKHFDEQSEPAALLALSQRAAVIEVNCPLSVHSNLLVRLQATSGEQEVPEFYAKISRQFDESTTRYLVYFTSVPPGVRARLNRLLDQST